MRFFFFFLCPQLRRHIGLILFFCLPLMYSWGPDIYRTLGHVDVQWIFSIQNILTICRCMVLTEKEAKGPWLLELSLLKYFFFFNLFCILLITFLYLWTYFKETYIIIALQVKESLVGQKGPTAYISWYVFQLIYFATSEKIPVTDFSGR